MFFLGLPGWGCWGSAGWPGDGALPVRLGGWLIWLGLLGFRQVAARMRFCLFFLWLAYLYLAACGRGDHVCGIPPGCSSATGGEGALPVCLGAGLPGRVVKVP